MAEVTGANAVNTANASVAVVQKPNCTVWKEKVVTIDSTYKPIPLYAIQDICHCEGEEPLRAEMERMNYLFTQITHMGWQNTGRFCKKVEAVKKAPPVEKKEVEVKAKEVGENEEKKEPESENMSWWQRALMSAWRTKMSR